jgi:GT2 family glycosyltransferase
MNPERGYPMKIHIVVIAYGLPEDTEKLLACKPVSKKNKFHWHLFLHSQIKEVVAVCEEAAKRKDVTYYPYGENRGLAKSWNEGILAGYAAGADVVIVCNDDMLPGEGDIEAVAAAAMEQRGEGNLTYMVTGRMFDKGLDEYRPSGHGFFAIQPLALETIGMYDEQFFPIYFEDMDYDYRARISGLSKFHVDDTDLVHQGSANINIIPDLMEQHHQTFTANKAYYIKKWGGEPGKERFTQPFNDLRFSTRIAISDCGHPYWGFEREDQEIVKI